MHQWWLLSRVAATWPILPASPKYFNKKHIEKRRGNFYFDIGKINSNSKIFFKSNLYEMDTSFCQHLYRFQGNQIENQNEEAIITNLVLMDSL